MNRKLILGIILIPIVVVLIIIMINMNKRYNRYVLNNGSWNKLINERRNNTTLKIINLKFNEYSLFIDEENSTIYYSIVNTFRKYNPTLDYVTDDKNIKIAFSNLLSDEVVETNNVKIIVYNEEGYRIYTLVPTRYSLINFNYKEGKITGRRIDVTLNLFDNHKDAIQRVIKTDAKLIDINNGNEYIFSLIKESLGNNKRENNLSIFGMDRVNEYKLTIANNHYDKNVRLFINNRYMGIYTINNNRERSGDLRYESNR